MADQWTFITIYVETQTLPPSDSPDQDHAGVLKLGDIKSRYGTWHVVFKRSIREGRTILILGRLVSVYPQRHVHITSRDRNAEKHGVRINSVDGKAFWEACKELYIPKSITVPKRRKISLLLLGGVCQNWRKKLNETVVQGTIPFTVSLDRRRIHYWQWWRHLPTSAIA